MGDHCSLDQRISNLDLIDHSLPYQGAMMAQTIGAHYDSEWGTPIIVNHMGGHLVPKENGPREGVFMTKGNGLS